MTRPKFGYCLPIFANPGAGLFRTPAYVNLDARTTVALGVHAEAIGFDSLWVADHLMLGKNEAILEGWTVLSALAGATDTAMLGMIHQAHYFRSPAVAAKMIATLDQISSGRVVVFYDFGRLQREHDLYHLPYPSDVEERVRDTIDGISLIRDMWKSPDPISVMHGKYSISNATCTPLPVQRPHPPIWFGEIEPGLLTACAQFGQGWNTTPLSVTAFRDRVALLNGACLAEGRDLAEIEISVELQVLIGETEAEVRTALMQMLDFVPDPDAIDQQLIGYANGRAEAPPASFADITVFGTPSDVAGQLRQYQEAGANHFLLWFLDAPEKTGMDLFAREVTPRFI